MWASFVRLWVLEMETNASGSVATWA
jgi:hypothetical protein